MGSLESRLEWPGGSCRGWPGGPVRGERRQAWVGRYRDWPGGPGVRSSALGVVASVRTFHGGKVGFKGGLEGRSVAAGGP
eukprot:COSAG01_NODE_135_length_24448_cov_154.590086_3_plen_80_part_00